MDMLGPKTPSDKKRFLAPLPWPSAWAYAGAYAGAYAWALRALYCSAGRPPRIHRRMPRGGCPESSVYLESLHLPYGRSTHDPRLCPGYRRECGLWL